MSKQGHIDSITEEAAGWIARLRSDAVSEADRQAFALWLADSPAHRRAMDSMLELWDDLEVVRQLPFKDTAPNAPRRGLLAGGLALAASLTLAVLLTPALQFGPDEQFFETRVGEQLMVDLADGSQVAMNTNSRLEIVFNNDRRELTLVRGEAYFDVARDTQRPFVVAAGDTQVTALGTAFNIYMDGDNSLVTVTEGVVRVAEIAAPGSRPADTEVLEINQAIVGSLSGLGAPYKIDNQNALAWREGKLVADGMTLKQLARELSRYHARNILIADAELGQKTVSGVFSLADPDTILLALEHSFDVRSITLDDGSIQLIRSPL